MGERALTGGAVRSNTRPSTNGTLQAQGRRSTMQEEDDLDEEEEDADADAIFD